MSHNDQILDRQAKAWRGGASLDDIASSSAASSGDDQAAGYRTAAAQVARNIADNLEAGQEPTEADIALYRHYAGTRVTN